MSYKLPIWESSSEGNVPSSAVSGGEEANGETIFVARANHEGELVPGKLVPSHNCCYICYNGKETPVCDYEVLTNPSDLELTWEPATGGNIPLGALQGGYSGSGEKTFVARASHDGSTVPGKLHPSHGCAYIPYDGKEQSHSDYEVLVVRHLHF